MSIRHLLCSVLFVAACASDSTTTPEPTPDAAAETPPEPPAPVEECSKCGGIAMPDTFDPANLCEASQPLFDAVGACACGIPMQAPGKCAAECAATACNPDGGQPDDACGNCLAQMCGPEVGACLNDV